MKIEIDLNVKGLRDFNSKVMIVGETKSGDYTAERLFKLTLDNPESLGTELTDILNDMIAESR